MGNRSFLLVSVTGFIIGLVFTLQSRPTLQEFGAVSWMPLMVGVSIVREIGPIITALICAGRIGSGIGAELGSMRVTEQIDAMEVSGTNPFKYLVVTRILATTLMLPLLVILSDGIALYGSFLVENVKGNVSFTLYFNSMFQSLEFSDLMPATIKTFFFGFAIGLVGCYMGYNCKNGTAGVV
jgi:phospholipid/cholesterol/gamma-HCH transport system permease protein